MRLRPRFARGILEGMLSRSSKKGPFVEERLMSRIEDMNEKNEKRMIRTWSRTSTAFPAREAADELEKVLQSAVSNAEANHRIPEDRLYIAHAYVDGGPVMKRWRARARGRVARIRKRTCHITVRLAERPEPVVVDTPPAAEEAPKP